MERQSFDRAIHAMLDRRTALLRDVVRSGGVDRWSHLHSHGHHYSTVRAAVSSGYLREQGYRYEITDAGIGYLDDVDLAVINAP